MTPDAEIRAIDEVAGRLRVRFPSQEPETVRLAGDIACDALRHARVRGYIPVLVEHEARNKLAHLV